MQIPINTRHQLPWYFGAVELWDRYYRWRHRIDAPESVLDSMLCVQVKKLREPLCLASGAEISAGKSVGILHLRNDYVYRLHADHRSSQEIYFRLKRNLRSTIERLASTSADGERFAGVEAFGGVTLFHHCLVELGFERELHTPAWPRMTTAMLNAYRPSTGIARNRTERKSQAVWIRRDALLAKVVADQRAALIPYR